MVPDPRTKKYDVYTQLEEPGEDPTHLFLWDQVSRLLASRFKVNQALIEDTYTGIPRGRVIATPDFAGMWIIAHGNDINLAVYRNDILHEFGLIQLDQYKKVSWQHDPHENMSAQEKKAVEAACKFKLTPIGII